MPSSTDQERVFSFETVRSPMKPEVDGVVRVPRMVGSWRLIALGAKKTRVVYQLDTSTGGSVPGWAVKGTLERIPFETLRGLRNLIAKR